MSDIDILKLAAADTRKDKLPADDHSKTALRRCELRGWVKWYQREKHVSAGGLEEKPVAELCEGDLIQLDCRDHECHRVRAVNWDYVVAPGTGLQPRQAALVWLEGVSRSIRCGEQDKLNVFTVPPSVQRWTELSLTGAGELALLERDEPPGNGNLAAQQSEPQSKSPEADAYVPVGMVWREQFDAYHKAKRFLDDHTEIKTRNPSPQRLVVHAGDWHRYWAKQQGNSDPTDEQIGDYLEEIEQRKAEVQQRK